MRRLLLLLCSMVAVPALAAETPHAVGVQLPRLLEGVFDLGYWHDFGPASAGVLLAAGGGPSDGGGLESKTLGVGAQGLWHAWGTAARGLHLGGELRWERLRQHRDGQQSFPPPNFTLVEGPSEDSESHGVHVGLLAGGRWTHESGLWLQAQVGVRHVWNWGTIDCCSQPTTHTSASAWKGATALTLGWAF